MVQRSHRPRANGTPISRTPHAEELWQTQRAIILLRAQLDNAQAELANWQRRLSLRIIYEATRGGQSQVPALQQQTAATHARVIELEHQLGTALVRLRYLRAAAGGQVEPWSAKR